MKIDLVSTGLESKSFKEIKCNYGDEQNWYRCWIEDKKWNGVGGPQNLEAMLQIFLDWAKPNR